MVRAKHLNAMPWKQRNATLRSYTEAHFVSLILSLWIGFVRQLARVSHPSFVLRLALFPLLRVVAIRCLQLLSIDRIPDLDSCVSNAGGTSIRCMNCLYAMSNLGSATPEGLRSCSNPNISGGMCSECYTDAQNFYNCATGSSFGVVITVDADSNTAVVGTGGVVVSGEPVVTAGQYGPTSLCPSPEAGELVPQSGDMCYTGDYDFLECFYTGLKCTCRNDYTTWLCVEYEGAN